MVWHPRLAVDLPAQRVPFVSAYARVNFVGKYDVPPDGWIRLPNARVRVLLGKTTEAGWTSCSVESGGEPWLLVDDGDFFPVVIRLDSIRDDIRMAELFLEEWTPTTTPC